MGRKEMVSHSSLSSESLYSTSRFYHRVQLSPFRSFYRSILSISLSFFGNTNATFFRSLKEGEMKFRFSIENLFIFIYIYIWDWQKALEYRFEYRWKFIPDRVVGAISCTRTEGKVNK